MTTINPEKLALLDQIELDHGSHNSFEQGHCAMEVVSWLADQGFTDAPSCASPVLRRPAITLNDRWDAEKRQALKPFLPRMVGTGGDGKDALREQIAAKYAADLLVPWLRLAGLDEHADAVAAVDGDRMELRRALRAASDAAWHIRSKRYAEIRALVTAKVKARLAEKPVAAAAAVAVADAVAVAVADAAAAADAVAAAVADAVADAAAAAAAAADADAAAAAAAAAVAVAVADAAAVAVAAAVADAAAAADAVAAAVAAADAAADGKDPWQTSYSAAYKAARTYYEDNPLPIAQEIADLAASQHGAALELLEKMIDPAVSV